MFLVIVITQHDCKILSRISQSHCFQFLQWKFYFCLLMNNRFSHVVVKLGASFPQYFCHIFAALAQEKQEKAFRDSIEGFHGEQLKHVEVQEKHGSLPDAASKFKLFKLWIKLM